MEVSAQQVAFFTAGCTLLGTLFGTLGSIAIAHIRAQERIKTETRKQIVDLAFKNWKVGIDNGLETKPVETFLIHMLKVFDLFVDKKIDAKNLEKNLNRLSEMVDKMYAVYPRKEDSQPVDSHNG